MAMNAEDFAVVALLVYLRVLEFSHTIMGPCAELHYKFSTTTIDC